MLIHLYFLKIRALKLCKILLTHIIVVLESLGLVPFVIIQFSQSGQNTRV